MAVRIYDRIGGGGRGIISGRLGKEIGRESVAMLLVVVYGMGTGGGRVIARHNS